VCVRYNIILIFDARLFRNACIWRALYNVRRRSVRLARRSVGRSVAPQPPPPPPRTAYPIEAVMTLTISLWRKRAPLRVICVHRTTHTNCRKLIIIIIIMYYRCVNVRRFDYCTAFKYLRSLVLVNIFVVYLVYDNWWCYSSTPRRMSRRRSGSCLVTRCNIRKKKLDNIW